MRLKNCIFVISVTMLFSCDEWQNDIYRPEPADNPEDQTQHSVQIEKGQLYNMDFDRWSKESGYDVCFGQDAVGSERETWGSASKTSASLGKPTVVPERDFVAVKGEGKCAAKLQTRLINALFIEKLAGGALFTGQMGSINIAKMNASLKWGVPFTYRPKSLEGYACYQPVNIDNVKSPYEDKLGVTDSAHVFVILTDWDQQFIVDPADQKFVDVDNDPGIIGYGIVGFNRFMTEYEKFTINIEYRNNRTPKYLVIICSSSAFADYFTGGDGSTLYVDEFKFNY